MIPFCLNGSSRVARSFIHVLTLLASPLSIPPIDRGDVTTGRLCIKFKRSEKRLPPFTVSSLSSPPPPRLLSSPSSSDLLISLRCAACSPCIRKLGQVSYWFCHAIYCPHHFGRLGTLNPPRHNLASFVTQSRLNSNLTLFRPCFILAQPGSTWLNLAHPGLVLGSTWLNMAQPGSTLTVHAARCTRRPHAAGAGACPSRLQEAPRARPRGNRCGRSRPGHCRHYPRHPV